MKFCDAKKSPAHKPGNETDVEEEVERAVDGFGLLGQRGHPAAGMSRGEKRRLNLADRAIILDMGEVVFEGTAQEVLDSAEIRQEYLVI